MKSNALTLSCAALLIGATAVSALADDSIYFRRQTSSPPGEEMSPEPEGEHAFVKLMNFRVPAQNSGGEVLDAIDYYNADGDLQQTVTTAKPLINVFLYGPVITFDDFSQSGFQGHGRRDAFAAVSLDDGATWKRTNLSSGAAEEGYFSLSLPVADAADPDCHDGPAPVGEEAEELGYDGTCETLNEYPGDATNIFHAVAGNKVLVAWQSKKCSGGFPGYTGGSTGEADTVAAYLGIDRSVDLYLEDLFVVSGSQESVDYNTLEEFEGEYKDVGEVPFSCLWSARGVLREDPDAPGTTEVVWFKEERLTSGRRDVNRIETACVAGAGCAITWQEDPEGLRPGEGEGAGTGWAGATTNSKTDVWYSFIEWEDLEIVDNDGTFEPLADLNDEAIGNRPQPAVPMAVPMRLTNNDRCPVDPQNEPAPYCNDDVAGAYGIKDQCVGTVDVVLGRHSEEEQPICVVDANDSGEMDLGDMPNLANTAASRPRLNLQPRDSNLDGVTDDAWVIIVHEEDKGLGKFGFQNDVEWSGNLDDTGVACGDPDEDLQDNCVEADIGKNQWYISFALGGPNTSAGMNNDVDFDLVDNLVAQHNQYNAPEVNWITGTFYPPNSTADMWGFGDLDYLIFNTEIARRASLMSQSLAKAASGINAVNNVGPLLAMPLFKEGIIYQGGPADIMARRIKLERLLPTGEFQVKEGKKIVNHTEATANPYDFSNLACEWYTGAGTGPQNVSKGTWLFTDGSNPYYPKGLCTAPAINLSARTPLTCDVTGISDGTCPTADLTCEDGDFGQLCQSTVDPEDNQTLDKLLTWVECPGAESGCDSVLETNIDDRSWYNPMDISKAHRGFLDGDFVFMIYAWSPNWKANAVGNDRYELYTRRSFDGGISWTTTPGNFLASDGNYYRGNGTTTCETMRDGVQTDDGGRSDSHICTTYAAGAPEQSRNVSQHTSMKITTLDPRYTPTIASMPESGDIEWAMFEPLEPTDYRRPDRNFVVFESGDNTTVADGEAEPLNLDYGRAILFGDHFVVWDEDAEFGNVGSCFPNDPKDDEKFAWAAGTGFCNEFDPMEGFPLSLSEEASVTSSAAGDFLYGVWGQFNVDDEGEFVDGDVMFRRIWFLDEYIPSDAYLPGQGQEQEE